MVKNPPANAGDSGLTPRSGRSPLEEEMATHSGLPAWRIPWTEEPGRLQSMESLKESDTTEMTEHARSQKRQHPGLYYSPRDEAVLSPEDSTQVLAPTEGEC